MTPAVAIAEPTPWQRLVLDYLSSFEGGGAFVTAFEAHWPLLLFSAAVLAVGRFARWPDAHFSIPFLAWAYQMCRQLWWLFDPHVPEAIFFVAHLLEGAFALMLVLVLVAGAVAWRPAGSTTRVDRFSWLSGLLAVTTVIVDWTLVLVILVPWTEPKP